MCGFHDTGQSGLVVQACAVGIESWRTQLPWGQDPIFKGSHTPKLGRELDYSRVEMELPRSEAEDLAGPKLPVDRWEASRDGHIMHTCRVQRLTGQLGGGL